MSKTHPTSQEHKVQHGRGATIVFWMLILLAFGAFAPCVFLPQWRQYQALVQAEQMERHRLDLLEREVRDERRLLTALRSDPAVVARLARREYRFYAPGERQIPVSIPETRPAADASFHPTPVPLPALLGWAPSQLPDGFDYDRVFCDDQTRPVIMALSTALLCIAFILFRERKPESPTKTT